jgi:hypothetical protein
MSVVFVFGVAAFPEFAKCICIFFNTGKSQGKIFRFEKYPP